MRADIVPGAAFPDYDLPDHRDKHRTLSELQQGDPRRRSLDVSLRPRRKLQNDLDIAEYTDPHHNPMIPHTLVLEPGLRV